MGSGPAPRRALAAAATALLAAAPLGCAATGPPPGPAPTRSATPEPTPATSTTPATPPERLCADLIDHWAGVILDAGEGSDAVHLDYQSMGLSGGQYEILLAVLADARAELRTGGPAAARELTAREAERRCAERYRSGAPTGGPWQ